MVGVFGWYNVSMAKQPTAAAKGSFRSVLWALAISNGVALILFFLRSVESQTDRYWFMVWNLFLGWLPLLFAWILAKNLSTWSIRSLKSLGLILLWLGFLPNSFYMISDLIHLHPTGEVSLLYDIVMFMSFIFNGLIAGFMSIYIIHNQLLKRLSIQASHLIIGGVILACSFAIYLGRNLRWNTWDVLVNPDGILFDVSDRVINPAAHPDTIITTLLFFLLLGSMYFVVWSLGGLLRGSKR